MQIVVRILINKGIDSYKYNVWIVGSSKLQIVNAPTTWGHRGRYSYRIGNKRQTVSVIELPANICQPNLGGASLWPRVVLPTWLRSDLLRLLRIWKIHNSKNHRPASQTHPHQWEALSSQSESAFKRGHELVQSQLDSLRNRWIMPLAITGKKRWGVRLRNRHW